MLVISPASVLYVYIYIYISVCVCVCLLKCYLFISYICSSLTVYVDALYKFFFTKIQTRKESVNWILQHLVGEFHH